ncbi:SusC/RagA family TonB-linked outer membrane protein [Negadavirga shengliensis]|uniref:SusC/RagA family TonB-linked outer membrane protein n=1 Tax=Negadavirga shengliensis TaxID=1389218 RepID=A0ABV9SV98_9BACT
MKKSLRRSRIYLIGVGWKIPCLKAILPAILSVCLLNLTLQAQTNGRQVQGTVISTDDNMGMPGVNVLEKGTSNGTVTDGDGSFSITVGDEAILQLSFIGYQSQEIKVGNQTSLTINMSPDMSQLEEVVVVGYGSVKKSDLTGAVSSISAKDFNQGVNSTVEQLIQGRVAGARVIANSGDPGAGLSISIRGASSINAGTSPLFVIDGLPVANEQTITGTGQGVPGTRAPRSPLNTINPSDIISIEVLKDASATAIYGARGANGVVLITTKQGESGKSTITYDSYVGVQNSANRLRVLSAPEYQQVVNGIIDAGGGNQSERVEEIANNGLGTDWQDLVYRENAIAQNHTVGFSGGNDKTKYFTSVNYQDQEGIIRGSRFQRYSTRLNLNTQATDKLTFGANLNLAYTKDQTAPTGYAINEGGGLLYNSINYDPTLPVYDEAGNFTRSDFLTVENPMALASSVTNFSNAYQMFGTLFGEYAVNDDLKLKVNVGGDARFQRRDVYVDQQTQRGAARGGQATIINGFQTNYLAEFTATYTKTIRAHSFNILGGAMDQEFTTARSNQSAFNFSNDITKTDNIGLGDRETYLMGSDKFKNRLISFLGRVNYTYKDKFLLTSTFRADGSSRFGQNNKFGYFPSVAGGWKLTEEEFLRNQEFVSALKLRASWGRTGNQEISNFQSLNTFGAGAAAVFNDGMVVTLNPARLANPDLKWETTEQWDVGVDFEFLNGRLSGSLDYYQKNTFDMLIALPVPRSTGFQTRLTNVGKIKNKGLDLELRSVNISTSNFEWSTGLTLFTLNNRVVDLGGISQIITGSAGFTDQIFVIQEGAPLRSFYGWHIDGVWQVGDDFSETTDNVNPGDLKYRDINGDGTVNSDDREIIGNSFPDLTYGISNSLRFKNITFDVFFDGVYGIEMLNNNLVDTYFPIQLRRNKLAEPYLNRWTPENPSDTYPSFVTPLGQGRKVINTRTVEDASYLRLKTIRLNYAWQRPLLGGLAKAANFYVTAENLMTWTNYSGVDPAVNSNGSATANIDFNTFPLARTFMAGISVTF